MPTTRNADTETHRRLRVHDNTNGTTHRMSRAIYRWHGDLFCSDCIVPALVAHDPWSAWPHVPVIGRAEIELADIAAMFGYNRSESLRRFPFRVTAFPEPTPCRRCLNWFL